MTSRAHAASADAGCAVEGVVRDVDVWSTPDNWASPQPCVTCNAPTMSGQRVAAEGVRREARRSVPPPVRRPAVLPGLSATSVAEKPPPNEAV